MRIPNLPFDQVVRSSIEASVVVLLILIVQWAMGKRLAPTWRCLMWSLVIIRLAMPVLPQSRWSLFNLARARQSTSTPLNTEQPRTVIFYGTASSTPFAGSPAPSIAPVGQATLAPSFSSHDFMAVIWIGGIVLLLVRLVASAMRLRKRLTRSHTLVPSLLQADLDECYGELKITRRPRLLVSQAIASPALYGIVRPILLVPVDLSDKLTPQELRFVLLHELIHLKRRDVLAGSIFWIFNAIHWFNPLLWYAAARFRADREIACDAAVLAMTHPQDRPAYGPTILKLLEMLTDSSGFRAPLLAAAMAQNRSNLKRRFAAIARPPSTHLGSSVIAIMLILVLGLLTLTRAQQPATQPGTTGTVERVYDVRDLAIDVQDFDAPPPMKVDEWGFPVPASAPRFPGPTTQESTREKVLAKVIADIERTVAFETWKDNGGSLGSVRQIPTTGQLIITQTPENHDLIRAVLDIWRSEKALQVVVESRFLGNLGELADKPPFPGKWIEENGARLWSEFLDDDQVQKVIGFVQQNQNSTSITAPRLTMFNHQKAYVLVANQTAYVAKVTPIKQDDGTTQFVPTVKNVPSGIAEQVKTTVSDDRHSVKIELHDVLNSVRSIESVKAPESDPASPVYYQVPQVDSVAMDATIDVPDGKTVLFQITPHQKAPSATAPADQNLNVPASPAFMGSIKAEEPMLFFIKSSVIVQRQVP